MKLSDSPAVEVLRLERLAVQYRLASVRSPGSVITINGDRWGSNELEEACRDGIVAGCEKVLSRMDAALTALGVDPFD